jgi:signal transduction histidine kinase
MSQIPREFAISRFSADDSREPSLLARYAVALLASALALLLTWLLQPFMQRNLFLWFFPAMVISASYGGLGPELLVTLIATLSIGYFLSRHSILIDGDDLRLEQVLQNLIQNAIKYSPPGAPVAVRIERQGAFASVAVVDHGIGIPEAALAQLFQRFYRAPNVDERQISGMGIGLFVVKEIVLLHNGTVAVESVEGQGSTFTIRLPLAPE